jgi:hypothetical protein
MDISKNKRSNRPTGSVVLWLLNATLIIVKRIKDTIEKSARHRKLYKNLVEILELKNSINNMKNSVDRVQLYIREVVS